MKINFLDLKEFAPQAPVPAHLTGSSSVLPEFQILTEYMIKEMFDLHMQASQTVWDRKMFDDEVKR